MPLDASGYWYPSISPKQLEIFNCNKRYLLVSGPRYSSKTIGVLHRLMRHCWETKSGRVGIFCKTIRNAKSGVWSDLIDIIIPEWVENLEGFELTVPPKVDGVTKMHYMRISNIHGNETEIQLHSLDNDHDIEEKIKGTRFSMIFFSELSNFKDNCVFTISKGQLRLPGLDYGRHQWIGDTNPAEEGTSSWIYKLWYDEPNKEDHPDPEYASQFAIIESMIHDNPYLSEWDKKDLIATFRGDPEMYDRYVLGKWTASSTDSHFGKVFKPDIHVIGNVDSPIEDEWEVVLPSEGCTELIGGWDLGDRNHAFHILEKVETVNGIRWSVLDELVVLHADVSLEDFAGEALDKIERLEEHIGNQVRWTHWSDNSSMIRYRASANTYDHRVIAAASDGKINLIGAPKFSGSVRQRVKLIKDLLMQNRLHVSAHCQRTIEMFKFLRKGKSAGQYVTSDDNKHSFDSLSYALIGEMSSDLIISNAPTSGKIGLTSVPI
tara:strand:- start:288 stop:1760 length:1473 start_codon:yes stop_codon:yes gene_type:complete